MEGGVLRALGGDDGLVFLVLDGLQALLAGGKASVLCLGDKVRLDVWPLLLPTVIAEEVAQSEHGVDVATLPVHAGAFEACLDD